MNTTDRDSMKKPGPGPLDGNSVTNFLQLGIEQKNRPVDRLIERLKEADGESWLQSALEDSPSSWFLSLEESPDAAELEEFKQQAKVTFAEADEANTRLAGLLQYLFVIAAGLNYQGALLSSQPASEISATLLDLAVALPAPWNDFIAEAAMSST